MNRPLPDTHPWFEKRGWAWLAGTWAIATGLLLALRSGYPFTPIRGLDTWIYSAYQWDLRGQIADFGPTYYGSRLSWIIPGVVFKQLFGVMTGTLLFKLALSAVLSAASAVIVRRFCGFGAAVLAVALCVLSPQIIAALHTDYVDTAVIVYAAVVLACIVAARDHRRWPALIFLAGASLAGMAIANLSALASVGLGLAVFHLAWLRWGFRRQLAAIGLYLAGGMAACAVLGLCSRAAGASFNFLEPQIKMLSYMSHLKDNPWIPKSEWWIIESTWLLLPVGVVLWGSYSSLRNWTDVSPASRLIKCLTLALGVSFAAAALMQYRQLDATLSVPYYGSFHLVFALPLLAALAAGESIAVAGLILLPLIALAWPPFPMAAALHAVLPFSHSTQTSPFIVMLALLAAALLWTWRPAALHPGQIHPALLMIGLFTCSMPLDFRDPLMTDRLKERYAAVHTAYVTLAREFPPGAYRFWTYPEKRGGISLASTKLWEYRLFSLKPFPDFEGADLAKLTEDRVLIVPAPPARGVTVLAIATSHFDRLGYKVTGPRIIPIAGDADTGFDLACFSLRKIAP